jgi:hypothetical protein
VTGVTRAGPRHHEHLAPALLSWRRSEPRRGGASIRAVPFGDGSDHLSGWESDLRSVEDPRARILRGYAPRDRDQYLKVDGACHLLSEVLMLQLEQDNEV